MKVRALCMSALVLWLVSSAASAQNNLTIYGRVDLSFDSTKIGPDHQTQIRDNASRLGFRGTEDVGTGLKVLYGLEFGLSADTNSALNSTRHSYLGLSGGFGAVAMGRLDSGNPTKSPIYSLITQNTDFVIHDAGATAIGTRVLNARNRTSNSIGYITPDFGGLTLMARYYFNGEEKAIPATGPIKSEGDIKQMDLGVNYRVGAFGIGIGYGQDRKTGGLAANDFDKKAMIVAGYDFGPINAYGLYGRDQYNATSTRRDNVDFWLVGASLPVSANGKVTANYMEREVQSDRDGVLKKFQIGYGHKLSKRTMLFALYDRDDPNSNVSNDVIANFSVGMQHNF